MKHYDWAEPGDPPNADYKSVRAKPLAKPKRYDSLTRDVENELIRSYHEHGDLDALDRLVGAHRPMVVSMAKSMWRGTMPLRVFIEYGMMGLRIAAERPRPSLTKKGETVGFDPAKGHRFSSYARPYAKKEMMAAAGGYISQPLDPDFEHKVTATVEEWLTPDDGADDYSLSYSEEIFRFLTSRRGLPPKCARPLDLWSLGEPTPRKPEPRNHLADRITASELANRDLYYRGCRLILDTYKTIADAGMTGWLDDDDRDEPWEPASGAFGQKLYRLAKKALEQRRKLGCKREGRIVPYRFNNGLGLFDRRGHRLPDYGVLGAKVVVIRKRPFTPFLCLRPFASIYSMRETNIQWIAYGIDEFRRHNPLTETAHGKDTARQKGDCIKTAASNS